MRSRILAVAASVLGVLTATTARAQPAAPASTASEGSRAEALISEGVTLREQGRDQEALEAFERAAALEPTPRTTAQIGLAHQALGRWVEAERELSHALEATGDAWIARNRAPLEQAQATVAEHLAWLSVDADAPGELWIEGRLAGRLPQAAPLRIVAGTIVIEVRAEGRETGKRLLDVHPAERTRASFALRSVGPAPVPAAGAEVARTVVAPVLARPRPGDDHHTARAAAWIALGAGAALVAGGVGAQVVREQNASIYDDGNRCLAPGQTRDQVCGSYRSTAEIATVLAGVGYALGGAALLSSTYLFWTSSRSPATSARCDVGPGAVGCAVSF